MRTGSPTASPPDRLLGSVAGRALGWSFLNTAVSRLGTLGVGIALARLLGPAEFGTFAIATVAMLAVLSFNDLGVSLAIVRWPARPELIAPTVTTVSLGSSAVLTAAMVELAPVFATAMGDPGATGVIRLMSLAVLVNGAVATPAALLQRNFQGGRRMVVDQVNTWLGAGVSIVLAVLGLGAVSLAVGRLAGSLVAAGLFVAWSPLPYRLGFDRSRAQELLRFGLPLAGASIIVFGVSYADQLVAGSVLGATALGFYVLAFNLSSWPVSLFSQPLRNVAPAAFARLQHEPDEMSRAFRTAFGLVTTISLPFCAVLAGAAPSVVALVYGRAWQPASEVLVWLAVLGAFRICFELAYDFLVVCGRSRALLLAQLAWLVSSVPALVLGARLGGLAGIAIGQVMVVAVVMAPLYALQLSRSGVPLGSLGRALTAPLLVALVVGTAAWATGRLTAGPFAACAVSGAVTLLALGVLLRTRRHQLHEARALWARPVEAAS